MTAEVLLGMLERVRSTARGWTSLCPSHHDKSPSLSIRKGEDDRILLHCFAGCATDKVCADLGITLQDLFHHTHADPDTIRLARARRELAARQQNRTQRLTNARADAQREAKRLIDSAKNVRIGHWPDAFLHLSLNKLADAYGLIGESYGAE